MGCARQNSLQICPNKIVDGKSGTDVMSSSAGTKPLPMQFPHKAVRKLNLLSILTQSPGVRINLSAPEH
jgi:hypothetical protein